MTNIDERPSFLARLAVVSTVGVALWQIFFLCVAFSTAQPTFDTFTFLFLCPTLAFFAIAGLYYLCTGRPEKLDAAIASRLYWIWGIELIVGAIFTIIIFAIQKHKFAEQFRF